MQVRDGMNGGKDEVPDNATMHTIAFTSKSLSSTEQCYSNIEYEALGICYGLEKFHHYYFAMKVCVITDPKLLVVILSKDVTPVSQ